MSDKNMRARLLGIVAMATNYCMQIENCGEAEPREFVASMLSLLPRIYVEFLVLSWP